MRASDLKLRTQTRGTDITGGTMEPVCLHESARSDTSPRAGRMDVSRHHGQPQAIQASREAGAGNSTRGDAGHPLQAHSDKHLPTGPAAQVRTLRYTAVFEDAGTNWSAFAPDVPGCCATGPTQVAAAESLASALVFHFEGMVEDKDPIPAPSESISALPDAVTSIVEVVIPKAWCVFELNR